MLGRSTEVSCPNRISSHRQKIRRATKNIWNASAIATRNHHTAAAKKRKLKDWWKRTCFQLGHRRIIESSTSQPQVRHLGALLDSSDFPYFASKKLMPLEAFGRWHRLTGLRYICKKTIPSTLTVLGKSLPTEKKKHFSVWLFPKILEITSLSAISSLYKYTMISKSHPYITHPFHLEPQKIHFANRAKDLPNGIAMAAPELNNQHTQPISPSLPQPKLLTTFSDQLLER